MIVDEYFWEILKRSVSGALNYRSQEICHESFTVILRLADTFGLVSTCLLQVASFFISLSLKQANSSCPFPTLKD